MAFTCLICHNGDLGHERLLVRANLLEAAAPIEVNNCDGEGWHSTQFQTADVRHRTDRLIELAHDLAAEACEMHEDEFSCDIDDTDNLRWQDRAKLGLYDREVVEIAHLLDAAGSTVAGDDPLESAQQWIDAGFNFSIPDISDWIDAGVWNPEVAYEFEDAGYTPSQITEVAQAMLDETANPDECARIWHDGCPIYDACQIDSGAELIAYAEQHFADA